MIPAGWSFQQDGCCEGSQNSAEAAQSHVREGGVKGWGWGGAKEEVEVEKRNLAGYKKLGVLLWNGLAGLWSS